MSCKVDRLESGDPCWLLKLRVYRDSKSTNARGPSLLWYGGLLLSCRYKKFFFCLGWFYRPSTKYFFPHRTLFKFLCHHRPESWAGSRTGPPVSYYVYLLSTSTAFCMVRFLIITKKQLKVKRSGQCMYSCRKEINLREHISVMFCSNFWNLCKERKKLKNKLYNFNKFNSTAVHALIRAYPDQNNFRRF